MTSNEHQQSTPKPKRPRRMAREPMPDGEATSEPGALSDARSNDQMPRPASKSAPKLARPSKAAMVGAMLERSEGASILQLVDSTGWQPHTCRAFLTGLRKQGRSLEKAKGEDGVTLYRLIGLSDGSQRDAG